LADGYLKSGCRKGIEGSSPSLYFVHWCLLYIFHFISEASASHGGDR